MQYFSYGSNMSLRRIGRRAACARLLGTFHLESHSLRFHKVGQDGSGKCDAFFTGDPTDGVIGRLFDLSPDGQRSLDRAEDLGTGYGRKVVRVRDSAGEMVEAFTYFALVIDSGMVPFAWYKHHVWVGALEAELPSAYLRTIEDHPAMIDADEARATAQWALYDGREDRCRR